MKKNHYSKKGVITSLVFVFLLSMIIAGCNSSESGATDKSATVSETETQTPADPDSEKGSETDNAVDPDNDQTAQSDQGNDLTAQSGQNNDAAAPADSNDDTAEQAENNTDAKTKDGTVIQTSTSTALKQELQITAQPESLDVKEGATAVFKISAKGEGVTYQWQCRESADKAWRKSLSTGSTGTTLKVEGKKGHNGFQFRCVVADNNGKSIASDGASLYVLAVTKDPTEENVKAGKTATFRAKAIGRDLKYEWQRLKPSEKEWKKYGSENTSATLKIEDTVTDWNACRYRCKITDAAGHSVCTQPAYLYVLGVKSAPANKNIRDGGVASFKVIATGKKIQYQWQTKKPSEDKWVNSGGEGTHTNVMRLEDISTGSSGRRFRCKITDADGKTIYSDSAKLYVFGIKNDPENKYVKKGGKVTFKVVATGKDLKYQWQKKKTSDAEWKNASGTGSQSDAFVIEEASAGLHGMRYRCKVTDSEKREAYSDAAVLSVLAITKNPSSQNVKAKSEAVFHVSAQGAKKFSWEVKEPTASKWRGSISAGHSTSTLRVTTGLSRNGYHFRCKVTDAQGNSVYSKVATLYVPGILKNPSRQQVKSGHTAVFRIKAAGQGLKYSWQVKESDNSSWRSSSSSGHTTNTLKVKGAVAHHGFRFRCKVTDSKGRVFYSKAARLYVLGIRTQPQNQSVDVGHTAVFRVKASGNGVKYQWQVNINNGKGWKNSAASGNKTSTLKIKTAASQNGYRFRCRLKDSKGNIIYTKTVRLKVFNSEAIFFDT